MLVYTVTNRTTKKVYVGTTASTAEKKWAHLIEAAEQGFDYPLYEEIRQSGKDNFLVEEWADGLTREETQALELEAITTFHGESIKGYKLLPRMPSKRKKGRNKKSVPTEPIEEIDPITEDFDLDLAPIPEELSFSNDDTLPPEEDSLPRPAPAEITAPPKSPNTP